ncbi:MAG TPA: gluconate 2-dehydrogenase subunit 3 family protein [Candidatus Margulisiibacteriota bacterium]|nr:gluconate 2-dehydrogenase subunit 3 family protein [Candidatus Margulisiibacteriota bacterium]
MRQLNPRAIPPAHIAAVEISRRQLLRLLVAGAGATALRLRHGAPALADAPRATPVGGFLSTDELVILDAATAHIIPTDSTSVGARECGAVDYIQSMLSFLPGSDANCDRHVTAADLSATVLGVQGPRRGCRDAGDVDGNGAVDAGDIALAESAVFDARPVYAGGPFSGRQPQPHFLEPSRNCRACHVAPVQDASGGAAVVLPTLDYYPPNFFAEHLPLPRLQALSWKIRILGADAVPEVADNPLASSLLETDLRRKYREGLASLEMISQQQFGKSFVQLTASQQSAVFNKADPDFITLLTYNTVEGLLCAPEYGGNRNGLGWQLVGFDGDSQPLGYTIYDESVPGNYRERPDHPNAGPNPHEDCSGFSRKVANFLTIIAQADLTQPGRRFTAPYCFDVES